MQQWERVLEEVFRTRRESLVGYAWLFALDRGEAEDLVQEAMVRTFARVRSFPDVHAAEGYVRQAVRTSFLDGHRRRRSWRSSLHLLAQEDTRRSPDETAVDGIDVRAALRALPPRERACVVLRYIDDLTVADIAADLRLSEGAVKRYLSDGTRTLRRTLGDAVTWPHDTDIAATVPVATHTGRTTR